MKAPTLPRDRESGMLRLYAWVMLVAAGLSVAFALLVTRGEPRYASTAEILISPAMTPSGSYIEPSMPTEQRVATSADVISRTAVELRVPAAEALANLSVTVPVDTQVLVLTYTADTPAAALTGAKAFVQTYLQIRNPRDSADAVASLVSPPERPTVPVGTNYPVVLGAAVLGGLLTGFGVARLWDRLRGRIRTIADAERCTHLDALAVTPYLPRTPTDGDQRVLAGRSLDSLAARVLGEVEEGSQSSVLVTGAATDSGSTPVAVLTALSLARMGRVVVLVTADHEVVARMSRDRDRQRRGVAGSRDLWPEAPATEQEGLHLVSVAEWDGGGVAAARLTNLLPELHRRLPEALVVIDGPPAWSSAGMALRADRILLVLGLGRSSRKSASAAVQALDHCAEKIMGLVITPQRGHVHHGLDVMRAWASLRVQRVKFRIGLPVVDTPSPRWSGLAAGPAPRPWTRAGDLDHRSIIVAPERIGNAGRVTVPRPNGEPTSSVAS